MDSPPTSWLNPKTLLQIGVPSALLIYLVWLGAQAIPKTEANTEEILQQVATVQMEHQTMRHELNASMERANQSTEEGNRILCAQCYIMARGDETAINLCACDARKSQ